MATAPNDPFQNPNASTGYGTQDYDQQIQPKKKSNKGCLIGCGVAGVLGLLVCCGGGGMLFWFAMSAYGEIVKAELQGNPVIVEHIGDIESVDFSFNGSFEAAEAGNAAGETQIAFDLHGSKGSGRVVIVQGQGGQDGSPIQSAILILPDGTSVPININAGPNELEELDMNFDDLIESGDIQLNPNAESTQPTAADQPTSEDPVLVP